MKIDIKRAKLFHDNKQYSDKLLVDLIELKNHPDHKVALVLEIKEAQDLMFKIHAKLAETNI